MGIQTALRVVYPPRCLHCGDKVESDFGLCATCWRDTPFINDPCCDACGAPLPDGGGEDLGATLICDVCLDHPRPWRHGRAALLYEGAGRDLVLALKYGDRHEIVRPAAKWMARRAQPLLAAHILVAPIPLHWTRMLKRRFNQSALLAAALAHELGLAYCPDLLQRPTRTAKLKGMDHAERFSELEGAIKAHPKRRHRMAGRSVLLVDDVLTSGATLHAATEVCLQAGAKDVRILTLARVAKDA